MQDLWIYAICLVVVLLFVWGARRFYYSSPRRFPGPDGRKWIWHPDGSFRDPDGKPVTDEEAIAACQQAWIDLHDRTARQTAAIQGGRMLGGD